MGVRQPAGVVVGMAPWNAPVILATRAVATPLAYGNTVVLKASEQCPRTHAAVVARARRRRRCRPASINLVIHAPEDAPDVVDELIAHPAVRRVNFTGSTRVGRIIALKCAEHLKRCLLELGGKAPHGRARRRRPRRRRRRRELRRVHELGPDLHVDRAASWPTARSPTSSARKLAERAGKLTVGDPRDQGTMIGPVVNDAARERILELIEDARAKGAEVLAGGEADGNVHRADGARRRHAGDADLRRGVVRAGRRDRAGRRRRRGGRASPTTPSTGCRPPCSARDVDAALEVARRIESGICHVNSSTVHDEPQMPFGGVKALGLGPLRRHAPRSRSSPSCAG